MDRAVPSGQQATFVPRGAESQPRSRSKLVNSTFFTAKPGFRLSPVTTRPLGALARAPVGSGPGEWEGGGKLMGSWDSGVVVPPTSWQRRTPPRRRSGGRPHWRPQSRGAAGEEDGWHFGGGSVPKTTKRGKHRAAILLVVTCPSAAGSSPPPHRCHPRPSYVGTLATDAASRGCPPAPTPRGRKSLSQTPAERFCGRGEGRGGDVGAVLAVMGIVAQGGGTGEGRSLHACWRRRGGGRFGSCALSINCGVACRRQMGAHKNGAQRAGKTVRRTGGLARWIQNRRVFLKVRD